MTAVLHVGVDFDLPESAITETFAFLAVRRAGKSNAAVVMAEEMYRLGLPWVAIDPKGDWWGMRSDRTGKKPGLQIPIFGGLHGDLPLEAEAGAFIAELIVRENLTCVLDASEFPSKAAQMRFLADFAERLYRLHGRHPSPRHIFLEEADDYLPQRVMHDQARSVGAWTTIVKRGGARGLGCSIVSQRSASVNKDALTQTGTLFALRTTSPQDRKAVLGWVDYHAAGKEIVDELPSLPSGEAWVVSPQFLGVTKRIRFNRRSTFDSGATPEVGKERRVATLADIDLGALKDQMATSIERAQAEDPKALRKRIAELEVALRRAESARAETKTEVVERVVEVPVDVPFVPDELVEAAKRFGTVLEKMVSTAGQARDPKPRQAISSSSAPPAPLAEVRRPPATPKTAPAAPTAPANGDLGRCERAVLTVLAQFPDGRSRRQVATLSGYSGKSSGFANALSKLRTLGLISRGEPIKPTEDGLDRLAGQVEPLPSGKGLLHHWNSKLGRSERAILAVLLDAWPGALTRDEIAERSGYSSTSSGFANALSKLRTLELIEGYAEICADETLAKEVNAAV